MSVWRTTYDGNPFLGLYARASDRMAIVPPGAPPKFLHGMKALGVPLHPASVDGSPYVGLYLALNSRAIIAPPFLGDEEKKVLGRTGLPVAILPDTHFSAVANNIACNDHGALVNPDLPPEMVQWVEKTLGVPVLAMAVAGYKTVGSAVVATNKGWLAHNRMSDEEAAALDKVFGVKGRNGTLNGGTPFVGLGAVANSRGALLGEATSGFEESRLGEALDLVD